MLKSGRRLAATPAQAPACRSLQVGGVACRRLLSQSSRGSVDRRRRDRHSGQLIYREPLGRVAGHDWLLRDAYLCTGDKPFARILNVIW